MSEVFNPQSQVAIIGTGIWGKNIARSFYELGVLGWAYDKNPTATKQLATECKEVKIARDIYEILSNKDIRAVVISTPAETHYDLVKSALLSGKHVFVEKPLALNYYSARELDKIATEQNLVLMVGHILLYHGAITRLKELIDSNELGNLRYLYSNRLNLGRVRKEENILWSFAPHDISVIMYLTGSEPESVFARGAAYLQPNIHDVTMTTMKFPKNIMAHIFVSWLHPFKEQRLVVIGDRRMVVFEDTLSTEKLKLYDCRIDWVNGQPEKIGGNYNVIDFDETEALTQECHHFVECYTHNKKPRTDSANGLAVLKVLEQATDSLLGQTKTILDLKQKPKTDYFVHETSFVDEKCKIGKGTKIWHFSHIQSNTTIGENCSLGQNVNIGNNVKIGNYVKIQNNVSVYEGVELEDYVFCGPSMVFTNISNPRSEFPQRGSEFYLKTLVKKSASIGANATIVCGNNIGSYAFIGAGAVVTREVPDFALVVGNPARQIGWMCMCGIRLEVDNDRDIKCKKCAREYQLVNKTLTKKET